MQDNPPKRLKFGRMTNSLVAKAATCVQLFSGQHEIVKVRNLYHPTLPKGFFSQCLILLSCNPCGRWTGLMFSELPSRAVGYSQQITPINLQNLLVM